MTVRAQVRRAMALLAAMTLATFGGPVAIGYVLRGGPSPSWPPDRPVEWATLIGVSATVFGLMIASVALAVVNQRSLRRLRARQPESGARPASEPTGP